MFEIIGYISTLIYFVSLIGVLFIAIEASLEARTATGIFSFSEVCWIAGMAFIPLLNTCILVVRVFIAR